MPLRQTQGYQFCMEVWPYDSADNHNKGKK